MASGRFHDDDIGPQVTEKFAGVRSPVAREFDHSQTIQHFALLFDAFG
jgi:hypothetical protein